MVDNIGNARQPPSAHARRAVRDVALILIISVAAEAGHFSWRGGRALICADSVQYVDGARALIGATGPPNFGYRKPGYSMILAVVALCFGNMGWAVVLVNHGFQALLPIGAYGLGVQLRSRGVGWAAAVLTIARLQHVVWADRVMSEAPYTCFLVFGLLSTVWALRDPDRTGRLLTTGLLLGAAWLIRSSAVVVFIAAAGGVLWMHRAHARRLPAALACLVLPFAAAVTVECAMNARSAGRFRPCTGTLGPLLVMRTRWFQGTALVDTPTARRAAALVPERAFADAYAVNKLDVWVARYRARTSWGMDEWAFDAFMRRLAFAQIASDPEAYAAMGGRILARQLLRVRDGAPLGAAAPDRRAPVLLPRDVSNTARHRDTWYQYWALPGRPRAEAAALVARMRHDADQPAPFADGEPWATLRFTTMLPAVSRLLGGLARVGAIWPGFALLGCAVLGLNRRACAVIASVYLLDAVLIAACAGSDAALGRFQDAWIAPDATLAGALVVSAAATLPACVRRRRRNGFPTDHAVTTSA